MSVTHDASIPTGHDVSRRAFLRGSLAAATVVGFDLTQRSWATEGDVAAGRATVLAKDFPHFDGELLTDDASLDAAAEDFGHTVSRRPMAVLRPGSVDDVVVLIRFARRHDLQVAARGQGHATFGQAQVEAGVVVDMSTLASIHEIGADSATVDAGVRWIDLLQQTVPLGLAPPVLTDFIELSVGGTLAVGGVGSQSYRAGAQVDHALELEVVTGRGDRVTCSPQRHRRLFLAVEFLRQIGVWFFPHPWIDLFLPGEEADAFIAETLAGITSADVGEGPVLINPYRREGFGRPFLRMPQSDVVFLFALLRNAIPPTPERAAELVATNRQLFERAVDAGGFSYPVDSVPKERIDWLRHYGPRWPAFALAKLLYDPDRILAPGQGIFERD